MTRGIIMEKVTPPQMIPMRDTAITEQIPQIMAMVLIMVTPMATMEIQTIPQTTLATTLIKTTRTRWSARTTFSTWSKPRIWLFPSTMQSVTHLIKGMTQTHLILQTPQIKDLTQALHQMTPNHQLATTLPIQQVLEMKQTTLIPLIQTRETKDMEILLTLTLILGRTRTIPITAKVMTTKKIIMRTDWDVSFKILALDQILMLLELIVQM